MGSSDIVSLLASLGIDARPERAALPAGEAYTLVPPNLRTHAAWRDRLAGLDGWVVVEAAADWLDHARPPSAEEHRALLAAAKERLAALDRWRPAPVAGESPDRREAVLGWMREHPEGGPLGDLMARLAHAPVQQFPAPKPGPAPEPDEPEEMLPLTGEVLVLARAAEPWALLAWTGFGGFNACPPTEDHLACAQRWARDHGARLRFLTRDAYALTVARKPATPEAQHRLADEQRSLSADEAPHPSRLAHLDEWCFWWD